MDGPLTDRELAVALGQAHDLETAARAHVRAQTEDLAERDAAVNIVRHVTALRKSLEHWIGDRAVRTQVQP